VNIFRLKVYEEKKEAEDISESIKFISQKDFIKVYEQS